MSENYTGVDSLEVLKEAKNYNAYLVKEVISNNPQGQKVLDFGAGLGTFSEMVREQGLQVECVEKDLNMSRDLKGKGFPTYNDLDDIPQGQFQYIFTLNVLEHIEDHRQAIRDLHSRLKSGGVLFIYVPAFNILFSSMDKKVGHYRRYTQSTLLPLLEEAGFQVEMAKYVDSLGFFAALAYKVIGAKDGSLNLTMVKFYDNFLFPISLMMDLFLKRIIGKNLAVRARRI